MDWSKACTSSAGWHTHTHTQRRLEEERELKTKSEDAGRKREGRRRDCGRE